jgi:hypothetical protein
MDVESVSRPAHTQVEDMQLLCDYQLQIPAILIMHIFSE